MIAGAIARAGARVVFIAPKAEPEAREPRDENLQRILVPREITEDAPRWRRAIASLRRIMSSSFAALRQQKATNAFLFMIPEPLLFTLPLLVLLRLTRRQILFLVHDAEPHAWKFSGALRALERSAHLWSYRLATKIIVLTPTVRDALTRMIDAAPDKIVVIPHGPFVVDSVPPAPGLRHLLMFGSLRRNKSVLEVAQGIVMARRKGMDVKLILAGEPLREEPGYWDECLKVISEDPSGFDVRASFISDDDLPSLLAEVDAFVLAYDNFHSQSGVAVLAALAGRPVIGTRSGGLSELFEIGMSGQVIEHPVTAESIASGIEAFYSIPIDEWHRRAALGAERVAETLSWDDIGSAYVKLIKQE
ncbi:glycosyltransferase family 4 protein [Microvirga sp. HBU67558]|nr:glycosyltransferase family 4 protein [Microvirga sp. HBU67558]